MHNGKCQGHPLTWLICPPTLPCWTFGYGCSAPSAALAECERIDECKDWANRADALASYAKQAGHDTLLRI
jgi:hypothetical protein